MVGDDVGSVSAFDNADVHGARPDLGVFGKRNAAQAFQRAQQFLNGGVAQVRIGRVRQLPLGRHLDAQPALGGDGDLVVRGFAVDEELTASTVQLVRLCVGQESAHAVALFTHHEQQSDGKVFCAQALGGANLRSDDALGVAGAASVDVVLIFRRCAP